MAKKGARSAKVETIKPRTRLNPYEGYYVSAYLRGRRFAYKGSELHAGSLNDKQLEMLAADVNFKHITKKPIK